MGYRGPLRLRHHRSPTASRAARSTSTRAARALRLAARSTSFEEGLRTDHRVVARARDESTEEARAHHRHHRPGRLVPGRAAARRRATRSRHHPPLVVVQHRAHRPHLPGPARARRAGCFLHYGDLNDASLAQPHPAHRPARRDLQPRRAVPRARLLRRARVHRRGHRRSAPCACSRRSARPASRRASTRRRRRSCSAARRRRSRRRRRSTRARPTPWPRSTPTGSR